MLHLGGNIHVIRKLAEQGDGNAQRDIELIDAEVDAMTWEMFAILDDSRTHGAMAPNPLSMAEVNAVMDLYGMRDGVQRRRIARRIRSMDGVVMEWAARNV